MPFSFFNMSDSDNPSHLVFEGDYGGQIYLTIPVSMIASLSEDYLITILIKLDNFCWSCNKGEGGSAHLRDVEAQRQEWIKNPELRGELTEEEYAYGVIGGMGGGMMIDDQLWLHEDLEIQKGWIEALFGLRY